MATPAQVPVSEYLSNIPASLRPTMQAARKTIRALGPKGTKEIAYRKWPIRYAVDDMLVCGVGNYPRWVAIYFFRGVDLDDPDRVLEGTGKGMRHIKLREPKDASRPEVKRMIRRAFRKGGITMRGETG
jgi:hypothetical protein